MTLAQAAETGKGKGEGCTINVPLPSEHPLPTLSRLLPQDAMPVQTRSVSYNGARLISIRVPGQSHLAMKWLSKAFSASLPLPHADLLLTSFWYALQPSWLVVYSTCIR